MKELPPQFGPYPTQVENFSVSTRMSQDQNCHPSENTWSKFSAEKDKKEKINLPGFTNKNLGVRMGSSVVRGHLYVSLRAPNTC